jgi:acetolactate synthase I/III small subunit
MNAPVPAQPGSAYTIAASTAPVNRHTLSVFVDNEPGVLHRIVGMFSARGYNIDSLTVSETSHEAHISRITIVTQGTNATIEQIKAQLSRLVPVHSVTDLTTSGPSIERELALVKVVAAGDMRVESLRLAQAFGAKAVDATLSSFVFEITGATDEIDRFVEMVAPCGEIEVARTGVAAIARGQATR